MAASIKVKAEARQKIRFSEILTPSGVVEVWSDLPYTEEEKAFNKAAGFNPRVIDYLFFPALKVGGAGKDAEDLLKWTFAEFRDHAKSLVHPGMPAEIYLSGKDPKVSAWAGDTNQSIRETFEAITKGIKVYEETIKEDGPAVARDGKKMAVDNGGRGLAALDIEDKDAYLAFVEANWEAMIAVKRNLEATNGRDELGQIRFKAKPVKAEPKTEEAKTEEAPVVSEEAPVEETVTA